ncbi:Peptidyl-prolyl isomerase cwc27 [Recurvomyces mirabilis]|nr:Peptidyl-prolyl isomerase cwc27 [Recurvomyces mirabilis]
MAALYNLEPQPTAKVILKTTSGDLTIELFAKQTPLASRNFLQHCLDGYYNNTIFHRLVANFILQGGDPTGSGSGGISAINDGDGFGDEIHSRIKFNRRGLLGMGKGEDGNGNEVQGLTGRCTMFGRIEGDTIYNLMKMADAELVEGEGNERPLYPTRITGSEILVNPFEDMVARVREAPRTIDDGGKKDVKKRKKPAGKNVLSFGVDEGEEDLAPAVKKVKANPKLVSVGEEQPEELNNTRIPKAPKRKERARRTSTPNPVEDDEEPPRAMPVPASKPIDDIEVEDEVVEQRPKTSALERTNAEIAALKLSMKRTVDTAPKEREKPKSALEAMIPAKSSKGRKRGKATDERGAIDLFKAFKQRLDEIPPDDKPPTNDDSAKAGATPASTNGARSAHVDVDDDEEATLCDLHFIANCQSCKSWDEEKPDESAEADNDDDPGWMTHQLNFAKDTLGKDLEWKRQMQEFEVIDPREKAREIKAESRKGKERERDGRGKRKV